MHGKTKQKQKREKEHMSERYEILTAEHTTKVNNIKSLQHHIHAKTFTTTMSVTKNRRFHAIFHVEKRKAWPGQIDTKRKLPAGTLAHTKTGADIKF